MLDLGITKMALIGVVALVVLGPERLPRVARTAGALWSRAHRYVNEVRTEVTRELELEELRRMKTGFASAALEIEDSLHAAVLGDQTEPEVAKERAVPLSPVVAATAPVSDGKRNWRSKRTAMQMKAARGAGSRLPGARRVMRPALTAVREPRHYSAFNPHVPVLPGTSNSRRESYATQTRAA
ncbi:MULTISPECIES: Sec-independent protein translocase protein TatB [Paraburkholderia]|uniref:Sec-independent protein translocase protein TatB n=1 Tax=Paraburkholderia unamae TaxID=219649 RepID=A0ACC6RHS3_9BURK